MDIETLFDMLAVVIVWIQISSFCAVERERERERECVSLVQIAAKVVCV